MVTAVGETEKEGIMTTIPRTEAEPCKTPPLTSEKSSGGGLRRFSPPATGRTVRVGATPLMSKAGASWSTGVVVWGVCVGRGRGQRTVQPTEDGSAQRQLQPQHGAHARTHARRHASTSTRVHLPRTVKIPPWLSLLTTSLQVVGVGHTRDTQSSWPQAHLRHIRLSMAKCKQLGRVSRQSEGKRK